MIDRRLPVLQAIARHGTVTAAARVCLLTPSAVSHQMQALARELDVVLLEPVGRTVRLTAAAHTLLEHTAALTAAWERAQADLEAHRSGGLTGTLRLCGFSTAAAVVAPRALTLLRRDHPGLGLHLREAEPAVAFDLLAAGAVDVAVLVATPDIPPRSDAAFEQHPLCTEPLDILVGPDHPLAGRAAVALAEVADDPWIVGTPGRSYHRLVTTACAGAGFQPVVAHHADEWDTGAALVAAGFGVALVPRLAALPARHDTRRIPVTGAGAPVRHVLTAIRAGSAGRPVVAAGLDALRRVRATGLPELGPPD
ncbi:LysR family transcriptional regulator [Pseudonocardia petroleophila]|uniref:LysR family transcriptional regulator n=1 Tax=Pseudonocardia petroleophila TaxID=37331 RepID=A0A7G7MCT5_9PSEU|nr:LysR family transcriptional regulator [Pseudonocardia petroleophila]QNG50596.1 LysR family transcriptional regulator [Pseudonocardia petroleophila]